MSEQSPSSPQQPATPATPAVSASTAALHLVQIGGDLTLPGWAVRPDTVVVHAGGITAPARVRIGADWVTAVDTFEAELGRSLDLALNDDDDGQDDAAAVDAEQVPWTALELPEGTLAVDVESFPPGITPPAHDPSRFGARVAFWCLVFPRMRGC